MVEIVPLVSFEAKREESNGEDEWRFERGNTYKLLGITDNMFDKDLIYLYLGDLDHCYLVEKKDIKIL